MQAESSINWIKYIILLTVKKTRLKPGLVLVQAVLLATLIYIVFNISHFIEKGAGYVFFNVAAGLASLVSTYFIIKSLAKEFPGVVPWQRLLKSRAYWRANVYLALGIIIAGLILNVSRTNHLLRAYICIAITGYITLYLNQTINPYIERIRLLWRYIDLPLFTLFLTLIFLEISLRLLAGYYPSPLLMRPNVQGMRRISTSRLRPNQYYLGFKVNSKGYVDTEFNPGKSPGTFRIVALGDSFAVATVPYEQNFLTLLDYELGNCDKKHKVEVYNMGISGTGPTEYDMLLEVEGMQYKPDEVLVCFFIGNDFIRPTSELKENIYPEDFSVILVSRRLLALATQGKASEPEHYGGYSEEDTDKPTFSEDVFMKIEKDRLKILQEASQGDFFQRYKSTFNNLKHIRDLSGGRVVIAIIPDEFQVSKELLNKLAPNSGGIQGIDLPQKRILEFCAKESIRCIDLLPVLRQTQAEEGAVYKPMDTHWNKLGNRVVAKFLAHEISSGSCR